MSTYSVSVKRIRLEAIGVKSFELVRTDGGSLPEFTPGAHIDVHIAPGIIRQYSLCNGPQETANFVISVKREPDSRGGSSAMHEKVREGDVLLVSAPRNNFGLVAAASHHVLVAGGIGVTPLLSMARHLLLARESFELLYYTRSVEHTAFHDMLSGSEFEGKVQFQIALDPESVKAHLHRHLATRPDGAHLYFCGPRPFMDTVGDIASSSWPSDAVHLEYFLADSATLARPRNTFVVQLGRTGGEYEIPAESSIVETLAKHGIRIETSCEQGICGTCLTGVLSGVPDHRDLFLTDEEKKACDKLTPCVSRAHSERLVLDL